jgi:hypothetical protein
MTGGTGLSGAGLDVGGVAVSGAGSTAGRVRARIAAATAISATTANHQRPRLLELGRELLRDNGISSLLARSWRDVDFRT